MDRGERGFTIVEIIVALGVLAVLMLAVTRLYFQNTRAQRSSEISASFSQLAARLGMALDHPSSCARMLAGKIVDPSPLASPSPVASPIPVSPLALEGGVVAEVSDLPVDGLRTSVLAFDRMMHDLGVQPSGSHGYLLGLSLRASKVGPGGAPLPGVSELSARFLVPVFIDPSTHAIQGCRDP